MRVDLPPAAKAGGQEGLPGVLCAWRLAWAGEGGARDRAGALLGVSLRVGCCAAHSAELEGLCAHFPLLFLVIFDT